MRSVPLALVRLLQILIAAILWTMILALLIRMAFVLDPAAGINNWPVMVALRQSLDPILSSVGTELGVTWPATSGLARFFPLPLAAAVYWFKSVVGHGLQWWRFQVLSSIEPPERPAKAWIASDTSRRISHATTNTAVSPGGTIGRYELMEEIGRGAMGAVYKAHDPQIGRTVALKVVLTGGEESEELRTQKERFYREARAAGKLHHPGIVAIHDVGEDTHGSPYLVMEFVEGTTLEKELSSSSAAKTFNFSQRLLLAIEIAEALDYAHLGGVIHRDIKPSNILIATDGRPKIADFGIAKLVDSQATVGTQLMGTPAFISPEQLIGSPADVRSDIFSFGVMLYWLFTGVRPFHGETMTSVGYQVVHTTPPPARQLNGALPEALDRILFRCLAKDPADRYQSVREVASALEALRDGRAVLA